MRRRRSRKRTTRRKSTTRMTIVIATESWFPQLGSSQLLHSLCCSDDVPWHWTAAGSGLSRQIFKFGSSSTNAIRDQYLALVYLPLSFTNYHDVVSIGNFVRQAQAPCVLDVHTMALGDRQRQ